MFLLAEINIQRILLVGARDRFINVRSKYTKIAVQSVYC